MTKISRKPLPKEDWEEFFDQLCEVIVRIKNKKEAYALLNDLWTYTEKKMFAKRLQIARMLIEDLTYEAIKKRLNVMPNTIAAVSLKIESGREGFEKAHQYLSKKEQRAEMEKIENLKESIKRSENPIGVKRRLKK